MNIFTIYSFFYSGILNIVYFSKKRLDTLENKLFAATMICNFVGVLLAIASYFTISNLEKLPLINEIVSKGYIIYLLTWLTLFTMYIFTISSKNVQREKKIIQTIFSILYTIFLIVIIVRPLYYSSIPGKIYSYGPSANIMFIVSGIYILAWIIRLLSNLKAMKDKKFLPIFAFMVLGIVVIVIQKTRPELLLMTSMETFVIFLMYFTIENPDIKLLEEAHKAKEISDNANEEKTLFVYNMTQEIRNITGKINDDADIILDSKEIPEIHDSARDIKALTSKFSTMTNDILDVSAIDSANIKTYSNKYNVKNLIKQLINVYGDICKNKEIRFRTNIDHDIPDNLYGDGISLKEVLNIILNNSAKYTNKGYIELSVNTIIKNDICRLIFTIEDSGTGIKSEDINKIKIDNKSLAKANKMITLMNGTMLISSDYGVGTKVKIILDQKISEEENTEVSKYESTFDNISILAIDDSESGLKIIEKLLKGTKIKLDLASTGKECLDKIKIGKYDLILLDEELSQISGRELLIKMKEIRNFKTPVVLLTKDNSYEYNEEYSKMGFADYILKPLKKDGLLEKIEMYTKGHKK